LIFQITRNDEINSERDVKERFNPSILSKENNQDNDKYDKDDKEDKSDEEDKEDRNYMREMKYKDNDSEKADSDPYKISALPSPQGSFENYSRTSEFNSKETDEESRSDSGAPSIRSLAYLLSPRMSMSMGAGGSGSGRGRYDDDDEVENKVVDTSNSWAAKLFVKAFDNGRVRSATSLSQVR
jgi:hypothetical protein